MKDIRKYWPVVFILIIWFIFSSPYFLEKKAPYSSTYQVNFFPPWSSYDKFHGPVKNNAMPDITDQIYPWRHFTIQSWKNGQIPLWNPNSFSGNPHLANYQSAVFSPLNLLFFILPFIDAWSLMVLLQPLAAGLFLFFLLREFGISRSGSAIGSLSFMFCGFMVVWMAYGTLSWAITFLPLSLYAIERWFNRNGKLPLVLLAISIPLSFFSGHFQTSFYFFLFTFFFLLFKISQKPKKFASLVLFLLLGVLISLFQIVPSIQFYLESVRSGIFTPQPGIPMYYLVNSFSPDFFGNPVTRNDWFGYYAEWASFVGIIPLVLAIFAVSRKNAKSIFFFLIGIFVLVLAVDSPMQKLIAELKIPVLSTSNPTRIIVLFSFAISVLSGFGFDRLLGLIKNKNVKKIVLILIPFSILFILIWILVFVIKIMPSDKIVIAQRNIVLPTIIFISFVGITFFGIFKNKSLIYVLILIVAFDSLRFAQKWMPFDPKELVFPDTPVISGIKQNIGYGRIFGNFLANIDTYYGLPSTEGYDPLYIERYGEFIRGADYGKYEPGERSVVRLSRRGDGTDRVLNLLGVSLIFHPVADTNQGWAYPVWENPKRFSVVFQDSKFQIFKNNNALNRVQLFYNYEVLTDKNKIIERFYNKNFDYRNSLILEEKPDINISEGKGHAQIMSYTPNRVQIKATTSSSALLFFSDNYYPGWKAKINGKEVKIYRADYSFKAIIVPPGDSSVEFLFVPGL